MKKLDDYTNKQIQTFPLAVFLSLVFIVIGIVFLIFSLNIIGAVFCFALGIFSMIMNIKIFKKALTKKEQISKVEMLGTKIIAKVEEQKYEYPYGSIVICSAEVNGNRCEFVSEPVDFDVIYACQELELEGLPVYVNMENSEEYAVDIRELENRVEDLT